MSTDEPLDVAALAAKMRKAPPSNRPCYFTELSVENIHCFGSKQTISFMGEDGQPAAWTILLGDNGMGKTTLLQCLAAMLPEEASPPPGAEEKWPKYFRPSVSRHREWIESVSRIDRHAAEIDVSAAYKVSSKEWAPIRVAWKRTGPQRLLSLYDSAVGDFVAYGYGAMRRLHRGGSDEIPNSDPCATLFDDNKALIDAEQWLRDADYAQSKSETKDAKDRLEKVKTLLIDLLPDVSDIRIPPKGHEKPVPQAKTPFGWVPVGSLSTGYRSVLAWVIDFASRMLDRYPRVRKPFAQPAVVLIDQIDLYLHPKWQREVMERLTQIFSGTQFIATAHSPLIIQAVPEPNLVLLERVGEEVHIINRPQDVRGWRTDQLLASDLFGHQPTRDPKTEQLMEERQQLLESAKLTPKEQRRLKSIDLKLGEVPYGESPEQAEMLAFLKKAATSLKHSNGKR